MTELAPYTPPGAAEIEYTWNLANKLCKTEFVPANLRNRPEAILAVFLTGRELGIGPMQSLRDIYPVNGRPGLMASLMVARVRGLGHRIRTVTSSDQQATVQVHRKGEAEPELPVTFTLEDAKRADLLGKQIWRQYPRAMLWNRAAAAACRRDCPEALGGAVYTPEELSDGDGTTTATWGPPEPPDTSDPGIPPGPGSDPTSEAGEREPGHPAITRAPRDRRHDPASDLNASVTGPGPTQEPPNTEAPTSSASSGDGKAGRGRSRRGGSGNAPAVSELPPAGTRTSERGAAHDATSSVKQAGSAVPAEGAEKGAADPSLLPEPPGWES